ncbi:MAG: propanediol/glycerol family dehydratase large subunit, partial [Cetobacterium sp.]
MRSKRFEVLSERAVNKDGFIGEWKEEGLIAMDSPLDPKSSLAIKDGKIIELDGKKREDF